MRHLVLGFIAGMVSWAIYLVGFQSCAGRPITVEEADAALVASCLVLSRVMTDNHPEQFDAVAERVCQPGRTRNLITAVITNPQPLARGTEYFDFLAKPETAPAPSPELDGGLP